jgi:cytochrome c biogenesis protein CcmG/thiol:disulfide interchange protein DsbE
VNPTRRIAALAMVAVVGLVTACGGDSAPVAAPTTTADAGDASDGDTSGTTLAPPDATISPDVPAEFLDSIGPIEVVGDPLPYLAETDSVTDPAVGTPAPVLVGLGPDGETVRVDAAAAGPTMVVFLAHWCPHCNAEVPRINQLRDEGKIPEGLNVVAVLTASNPGRPNYPPFPWIESLDWTYPAMLDGIDMEAQTFIAAQAYGVSGFPFITLIDANGDVAARWSGEREPDEILDLFSSALGL